MSSICPHCNKVIKESPTPRIDRAAKLAKFLGREFKKRKIMLKECPAQDIAELALLCLDKGLVSKNTSRGDRIFSMFKHLHAFAEDLKPYGPKSRRAGYYRVWMTSRYGVGMASELTDKADRIYKELKHGTN